MTAAEARRYAIDHLEREGFVVYTRLERGGLPMMGQVAVVWPGNGRAWVVRIMVGKRPRPTSPLFYDKRRVGRCDLIALVDPRDRSVSLTTPVPHRNRHLEEVAA